MLIVASGCSGFHIRAVAPFRWFYVWPNYWKDRKITDIAREFDIAYSVVSRLWKSFKSTGMCSRRHGETPTDLAREWYCLSSRKYPENDQYPTCSIMVWGRHHDQWPHVAYMRLRKGIMTDQRYIDEVLLPHVRLFRRAVGDKFVFYGRQRNMSSNTRCSGLFRQRGQVAGRNYPPTNKNTLIRALTEEWDKLPQQLLDNVVQSMVQRVECCITLHGGHIPY
ncbi:uncharacterized protein TNCV_654801 [Trichonephila clavipes]|nr:uncharacterized protein TNCV_654801 [Trichonephila clavipes]